MRFQRQTLWVLVGLLALVTAACDWPMYQFSASHQGYNPKEQREVVATRRRVKVELELPMKDEYGQWLRERLQAARPR